MKNIPRLVLAGTNSGAGKTTLTLGLLKALKDKGYKVQPFKVGPDYIDTGLHQVACKTPSHNLDSWMGSEKIVKDIFTKYTEDKDLAIIEGVMGLFDGAKGEKELGSTAHIAKLLQAEVILVVNAKGMARSAAALIQGYQKFDPELKVSGVIFNNVGSDNHIEFLKNTVAPEIDIPILGFVKRKQELSMPERHLGLVPAQENKELEAQIEPLGELVKEGVDLEGLFEVASKAKPLNHQYEEIEKSKKIKVKIGLARDRAFNFYYQDSLNYLEDLGAELLEFSPLDDQEIPEDIDGLYLGGGFPEMFLEEIAENDSMRRSIQKAFSEGLPIYAECGGYMYLLESLEDFSKKTHQALGLIKARGKMTKKLSALGYVQATALRDSIATRKGDLLKGHEFHWSEIEGLDQGKSAYSLLGGRGKDNRLEGFVEKNLLASYLHLHLRSNPEFAERFLKTCLEYRKDS